MTSVKFAHVTTPHVVEGSPEGPKKTEGARPEGIGKFLTDEFVTPPPAEEKAKAPVEAAPPKPSRPNLEGIDTREGVVRHVQELSKKRRDLQTKLGVQDLALYSRSDSIENQLRLLKDKLKTENKKIKNFFSTSTEKVNIKSEIAHWEQQLKKELDQRNERRADLQKNRESAQQDYELHFKAVEEAVNKLTEQKEKELSPQIQQKREEIQQLKKEIDEDRQYLKDMEVTAYYSGASEGAYESTEKRIESAREKLSKVSDEKSQLEADLASWTRGKDLLSKIPSAIGHL